ncbi:MAG TPA: NADPH-dependent FMN reductase [Patescibacteria group bacterium]|nr:NADPH-dependent FMN reductase [Patescibacteria group bacterium]
MIPNILAITASTRGTETSGKVTNWLMQQANSYEGLNFTSVKLAELNLPPLAKAKTDLPLEEKAKVDNWAEMVNKSDGFIIIVPEYNHSFPGDLKHALDWLFPQWFYKPVTFVGYSDGISGGIRAIEQLCQVSVELHMTPIKEQIQITFVDEAFEADGTIKDPRKLTQAQKMFNRLEWWAKTLKYGRENFETKK